MTAPQKRSFEEREQRLRASLERTEGALAEELIKIAKSLQVSALAAPDTANQPRELPETDGAIRAAIAHTFTIVSRDARPSDESFDQVEPETEGERRALLANSTAVLIDGRRRLLLTDAARANLLDRVHTSTPYAQILKAAVEEDKTSFGAISMDDERLPSAWLRSFLIGDHGDLARAPAREVRAAIEALERLQLVTFTTPPRPDLVTARRLRGLAEILEPLRILIGQRGGWEGIPQTDRFVGRKEDLAKLRGFVDELASESVGEYVQRLVTRTYRRAQYLFGVRDESVLFLEARGGLGKSTLMAKFMLDHALSQDRPFPFAYLDFDRAALRPRDPHALLLEVARQVQLQLPSPLSELDRLCSLLRNAVSSSLDIPGVWTAFREAIQRFFTRGSRPFLVVLDTMEVVQYDPPSLAGIITFLTNLSDHQRFTELKIVASGRADVPELRTNAEERPDQRRIVLEALPVDEAREMANQLGTWLMFDEWHPGWAADVGGRKSDPPERREPLTLRVAVELLRDTPKDERPALAREIGKEGEKASELFVGRLYARRILGHVRNPEVRRLAWPGLVFRRVTPDLIRNPLAGLCEVDPGRADELFSALANEVWMVEDHGANTIRHRPDLRARTLPLMRRQDPQRFARVNAAAVDYFSHRLSDPAALGEWIYHRLLGGEDCESVDRDWTASLSSLLAGAEEDFDRNSEQRSYILSRTAARLLPPAQLARLPTRLALDHVARTGHQLGAFDDTRIEPTVVDLAARSADVSTTIEHPVRAVLLVKTGQWDVEAFFGGGSGEWAAHAAFARGFKRARVLESAKAASAASEFAATASKALDEGRLTAPTRAVIQDLAYSRMISATAARILDEPLARLLRSTRPTHSPTDAAALRTAIVFGWEACRPAAKLWLESQRRGAWSSSVPSISLAEIRVLMGAGKRVRDRLRSELEKVLERLGITWRDVLSVVRDPVAQPMRVSHEDVAGLISIIVMTLIDDPSPDSVRHLRGFFAARDEDWIVPLAYAAARTKSSAERSQLLNRRLDSHAFDREGLFGSRSKRPWSTKGTLGMLRAANDAGDLLGVARIFEETGRGQTDLRRLLVHYARWRERIQLLLDEEGSEDLSATDRPPKPLPVSHKDDIQKDRWGGTEDRDGRRLEARLGEVGAHDFDVDLTVRSTDGSVLQGPVIFHLHHTFPRSRIAIRAIHEGSWATLEEVNAYGVFTAAAQVRDRSGRWTSLEIDLKILAGLPRRFLSR